MTVFAVHEAHMNQLLHSSDDVAHIITQLNHFWLYIQPWHKLHPAAAVLSSRLQVMKMDSVATDKKQFEVYALEA